MFALLYDCPKCGQVWRVYKHEFIDTDRDDVELFMFCEKCNSPVSELPGKLHALTDDEQEQEFLFDNEDMDNFPYDDDF